MKAEDKSIFRVCAKTPHGLVESVFISTDTLVRPGSAYILRGWFKAKDDTKEYDGVLVTLDEDNLELISSFVGDIHVFEQLFPEGIGPNLFSGCGVCDRCGRYEERICLCPNPEKTSELICEHCWDEVENEPTHA